MDETNFNFLNTKKYGPIKLEKAAINYGPEFLDYDFFGQSDKKLFEYYFQGCLTEEFKNIDIKKITKREKREFFKLYLRFYNYEYDSRKKFEVNLYEAQEKDRIQNKKSEHYLDAHPNIPKIFLEENRRNREEDSKIESKRFMVNLCISLFAVFISIMFGTYSCCTNKNSAKEFYQELKNVREENDNLEKIIYKQNKEINDLKEKNILIQDEIIKIQDIRNVE